MIHLSNFYSLGQHFGCHNVSYVIDLKNWCKLQDNHIVKLQIDKFCVKIFIPNNIKG